MVIAVDAILDVCKYQDKFVTFSVKILRVRTAMNLKLI